MRFVKSMGFVLVLAGSLAGCGNEGAAKDAVRQVLNDPDSAKFSELRPGASAGDTCGYVNAKNRMGGYVGDTPFFYEKSTGTARMVKSVETSSFRLLWHSMQANSNFTEEYSELAYQCQLVSDWERVCGLPAPVHKNTLCTTFTEGPKTFYDTLKAAFGS